jgi:cell division septation protein DedD
MFFFLLAALLAVQCAKKQGVKTGESVPAAGSGRVEEGEIRHEPAGGENVEYAFRVQLYATTDGDKAREVALSARELLGEKTYVEFQEPIYKVQLGDYRSREAAEEVRYRAASRGFDEAWIVETSIR